MVRITAPGASQGATGPCFKFGVRGDFSLLLVRVDKNELKKEINVKVRLPAWATGKQVKLDLTKISIKLTLDGEKDSIIEGMLRGTIKKDSSFWTMEEMPDGGKMLYLTLEKIPEYSGSGPWMGVVQGEDQVKSDYPEEKKAAEVADGIMGELGAPDAAGGAGEQGEGGREGVFFEDPDPSKPKYTGLVREDGFCEDRLPIVGSKVAMRARQVPADGNALFHSLSAAHEFYETGEHPSVDLEVINPKAQAFRQSAVDYLKSQYDANKEVYVEGRTMSARELVGLIAEKSDMRSDEYLRAMRSDSMWGGGPEIVAMTSVLQRPIHVYELASTGLRFGVRRMATFGSPLYDSKGKPLHLLSTYSQFPDTQPSKTQTDQGNHFVPLFPEEDMAE